MKLVAISDTHCHPLSEILTGIMGDVLIHAGDALNYGSADEFSGFVKELECVRTQFRHVVYVPGNHDFFVQHSLPTALAALKRLNIDLVINQRIEIEGVSFYGSPDVPLLPNHWAFSYGQADQTERWSEVQPADVLITHGPPFGILDVGVGCKYLRRAVDALKPKLHIFGHIHEHGGESVQHKDTLFSNVATCNRMYRPAHDPFIHHLAEDFVAGPSP